MIQPSAPAGEPPSPDPSASARSPAIWLQLPPERRQQSLLILAQMLLQAHSRPARNPEAGHDPHAE